MSQNLNTLALNRNLASSTAATLLPEPLLDLKRPVDLDLVLGLEGDLDLKHSSSVEEDSSLNLDPKGSAPMLYTEIWHQNEEQISEIGFLPSYGEVLV